MPSRSTGAVRVHSSARKRRRSKAVTDESRDLWRAGHGLRVGEVERGTVQSLLDQARRPVELFGRLARRDPIEQEVAVRVRSDIDEAGRTRVAQRRPRNRPPVVGELDAVFDERGRRVEGRAHPVALEDGYGHIHEVGGSVVERDHHGRVAGRRRGEALDRGTE